MRRIPEGNGRHIVVGDSGNLIMEIEYKGDGNKVDRVEVPIPGNGAERVAYVVDGPRLTIFRKSSIEEPEDTEKEVDEQGPVSLAEAFLKTSKGVPVEVGYDSGRSLLYIALGAEGSQKVVAEVSDKDGTVFQKFITPFGGSVEIVRIGDRFRGTVYGTNLLEKAEKEGGEVISGGSLWDDKKLREEMITKLQERGTVILETDYGKFLVMAVNDPRNGRKGVLFAQLGKEGPDDRDNVTLLMGEPKDVYAALLGVPLVPKVDFPDNLPDKGRVTEVMRWLSLSMLGPNGAGENYIPPLLLNVAKE